MSPMWWWDRDYLMRKDYAVAYLRPAPFWGYEIVGGLFALPGIPRPNDRSRSDTKGWVQAAIYWRALE